MKKLFKRCVIAAVIASSFSALSVSASDKVTQQVLFKNVSIFNGIDNKLYKNSNVLIEGNLIKSISAKDIKANADALIIDGEGRTLMPGLIEGHGHLQMNGTGLADIENNRNWEELAVRSAARAKSALMSGFTTWRDAGGMGAGLRKSIDAGVVDGPRIYSAGAFIGPTGSHADFRNFTTPNETFNGPQTASGRLGVSCTADSIGDIKACARQNFMQGATQIKVMSSGGVASAFDPWQLDAYSQAELAAAVEVADAYGSYVMSHAYSKKSMIRNLEAGVKTLEHGFMFDAEVAKLMEEKGAYITTNMTAFSPYLGEIEAISGSPAASRKAETAQATFKDYLKNVNKYQPKLGFHVDCVGGVATCEQQADHSIYLSGEFIGNYYTLKSMTSTNGEIVKLTGSVLDPYFQAKLGVVAKGAYADLLLVDGNPLEDLTVIGANKKWFDAPARDEIKTMRVIMKDGKIYKNTL
ncbi:metal-dependent hydrolase family protein [Psychromonas sp. Urea-02u-13]|uniref:metal-dependent hydrolase family protein n=1 Tax=Psychromonas sp. Urea-02u-13 TaxID=2058326 RepID=UPI000C3370B1|nr:amidohydrolase family protein [Psychromonas sp. Urea-02u-13]PKG38118.1 amidohydrolase [Psychromonas sp. Urea-02u-13]